MADKNAVLEQECKEIERETGIEDEKLLDFHENVMKDFILRKSSSNCNLDEIDNFVYGPFMSRFWMLRKHILLMDQ